MSKSLFAITKLTIAYNRGEEMVRFYNNLFTADLKPIQVGGFTFYKGVIAGLILLFCPNEMLRIKAEKNNIQFTVQVDCLDEILSKVIQLGGNQIQEVSRSEYEATVGITDPDGNTIELIERLSGGVL